MTPVLLLASSRFFLRHPWQFGLAVAGIALGVAVVISIDLVKTSAANAFDRSTEVMTGNATHRIIGGPTGLPESIYVKLRTDVGITDSAPVVEGYVGIGSGEKNHTLLLLGIDPFADGPFRQSSWTRRLTTTASAGVMTRLMTEPGAVLMDELTARKFGVMPGDEFEMLTGTRTQHVTLVDWFTSAEGNAVHSIDNIVFADISTAQELLGMVGRLSHIDVMLEEPVPDEQLRRIEEILPDGVELVTVATRKQSLEQMTSAFHTNLTALSLLALLVGMFLIYNTMTFMVMQRRGLIGNLRALGVTRSQITRTMLVEVMMTGIIGSGLGLLLGIVLAQGLIEFVGQTINDLYFLLPDTRLNLSAVSLAKGIALGVVGTMAAAALPMLDANRITPRQAMSRAHLEQRTYRLVNMTALSGLLIMVLGYIVITIPGKSVALGFVGIFAGIFGFTLLTPLLTTVLTRLFTPVLGRLSGLTGKMAARSIIATLSRTAAAIAALMVAVAAVIGIGLMIHSFRISVDQWLQSALRADVYVSVRGPVSSGTRFNLNKELAESILALPEVDELSSVRRIKIESQDGLADLAAYELNEKAWAGFQFKEGNAQEIWKGFNSEDIVIVTEPYAYHRDLEAGDVLSLRTDQGQRNFTVAGIYYDYSSDRGVVAMSRDTYKRHWDDDVYSGFGVYAANDVETRELSDTIRALTEGKNLVVLDRRSILQTSLEVFDQTFVITEILRTLAAIIAFAGVFSALMALQLERGPELGLLRAIGLLPRQLWSLIVLETGLLGLIAGLLAIPAGYMITSLLVFVINRRSFGWSMEMVFEPAIIVQGILLGIVAALLAGIYPAYRMSQTQPAAALRSE